MNSFHKCSKLAATAAMAVLLAACGAVMTSELLDRVESPETCGRKLGSYTLSRTLLRATVFQTAEKANYLTVEAIRVPDNRHRYCLDYLESSSSSDVVDVKRSQNGLLVSVSSEVTDNTAVIVRKIIRAVFIFLSKNPDFRAGEKEKKESVLVAELEFDPFDPGETALINSRLADLGFCIFVEDFAFDTGRIDPGDYCSSPKSAIELAPSVTSEFAAEQVQLSPGSVAGVKYRPVMHYQVEVWRKPDTEGPEPWQLAQAKVEKFENISPILSIGVSRATFAKRRTYLAFNEGVLQTVCVSKGSEVNGAVQIPLDIVYGISQLPAKTIEAQLKFINGQSELVKAQDAVIKEQQKLIQLKRAIAADPLANVSSLSSTNSGTGGGWGKPDWDAKTVNEQEFPLPGFADARISALCKSGSSGT